MENEKLDLAQIRNVVRQYIDCHMYKAALFWADKVCTLSRNDYQDILGLAHCMFMNAQYTRAAQLLKLHGNLILISPSARYLAAKCYYEIKDYPAAIEVLESDGKDLKPERNGSFKLSNASTSSGNTVDTKSCNESKGSRQDSENVFTYSILGSRRNISSAAVLLKGLIYEQLENREMAMQCYKNALQVDVLCYEALELLVAHRALNTEEEKALLSSLPYTQLASQEEINLVKFAYKSRIEKYDKPVKTDLPKSIDLLNENSDFIVSLAERHFNHYHFREAYKLTAIVVQTDPLHESCLPVYISCLVELKKTNELYNISHNLVNTYPTKAISWYAVASYYLLINKNETARKFFSKTTNLDNNFGPAWIGFAHSYAVEGEHDQAISAYFSAAKLMNGSHLPLLYLGLEYSLSNNTKLALKFYKEALSVSPKDPHIKLELGALFYQNGEYETARSYLEEALESMEDFDGNTTSGIVEPIYNNLGHVLRKLKDYNLAIKYHEKSLMVSPRSAATYTAIGLNFMLIGDIGKSISMFHRALSLKKDDTFTIQLLTQSLDCFNYIDQLYFDIEVKNKGGTEESLVTITESSTSSSKSLNCSEMPISESSNL